MCRTIDNFINLNSNLKMFKKFLAAVLQLDMDVFFN